MKVSGVRFQVSAVALLLLPGPTMGSRQAPDLDRVDDYVKCSIVIRWAVPLHQFPMLGFRAAVNLEDSALEVDQLLRGRPVDSYNCHFYTKVYVEGSMDALAGIESINDIYLTQHGFRKSAGRARVGDIIVAVHPPQSLDRSSEVTHSGVVTEVDGGGRILTIRQKFNPTEPVVDLDLTDFISLYAGKHPWEWAVWSRKS